MFLYIFVFIIFQFSGLLSTKNSKKSRLYFAIFAFVLVFLLLALRDFSVGGDLYGYQIKYNHYSVTSFDRLLFAEKVEPLFIIFNKACAKISNCDFRFYLVACAFVFSSVLSVSVYRLSNNQGASWIFIMAFSTLVYGLSGLRSSFGLAFGVLGYSFLICDFTSNNSKKKKYFWYLFFTLVGSLFHYTALAFFILLPLEYLKRKRSYYFLYFVLIIAVALFGNRLFPILQDLFFPNKVYNFSSESGFGLMIIVTLIRLFLEFYVPKKNRDDEYFTVIRLFELVFLSQVLSLYFNLWSRISQYFMVTALIMFPNLLMKSDKNNINKQSIIFALSIVFFAYFVWSLSKDSAGIVPYRFLWDGVSNE